MVPVVEPERRFVQVPEQVKRPNANVRPVQHPFQQASEVLYPIREGMALLRLRVRRAV